jgi:putative pyruvate formate lyase activating enzyme
MNQDFIDCLIERCTLCPRKCNANRLEGKTGSCGAGKTAKLASAAVHIGEEPPISGTKGSATFFFSFCPLHCKYCQNFPISQIGHGKEISIEALAERMVRLAGRGAHNINIVTGTHFAPHIIEAVKEARSLGMKIPIVWNTSGYETPETIDLLNGAVDMYLTDIKYADNRVAEEFSDAVGYFEIALAAALRMVEQVGPLVTDENGIGVRGVIIRHLVLPQNMSQTETVMRAVRERIGVEVPVSLMGQYFPAHLAHNIPDLSRALTDDEYEAAEQAAVEAGIEEGWFQDMDDPTSKRGA